MTSTTVGHSPATVLLLDRLNFSEKVIQALISKSNKTSASSSADLIIERRLTQLEKLLWTIQEATLKEEWKSRVIALWMAHAEGRRDDERQMEGVKEEDLRSEVEKRDSVSGKLKVKDGVAWPSSMHNLINLQSTSSASSSTASQKSSRDGNCQKPMTFGQSSSQQHQPVKSAFGVDAHLIFDKDSTGNDVGGKGGSGKPLDDDQIDWSATPSSIKAVKEKPPLQPQMSSSFSTTTSSTSSASSSSTFLFSSQPPQPNKPLSQETPFFVAATPGQTDKTVTTAATKQYSLSRGDQANRRSFGQPNYSQGPKSSGDRDAFWDEWLRTVKPDKPPTSFAGSSSGGSASRNKNFAETSAPPKQQQQQQQQTPEQRNPSFLPKTNGGGGVGSQSNYGGANDSSARSSFYGSSGAATPAHREPQPPPQQQQQPTPPPPPPSPQVSQAPSNRCPNPVQDTPKNFVPDLTFDDWGAPPS
ncbi:hypothetical protein TYRP_013291 [Tyrophagus putrescentiae]|nr:hypothetical protein TYRP_013291 [Tyrophagus putrescentiae]